jgi:hypothetical protein
MGRQIPFTDWCPNAIAAGASAGRRRQRPRRPRSSSATCIDEIGSRKFTGETAPFKMRSLGVYSIDQFVSCFFALKNMA